MRMRIAKKGRRASDRGSKCLSRISYFIQVCFMPPLPRPSICSYTPSSLPHRSRHDSGHDLCFDSYYVLEASRLYYLVAPVYLNRNIPHCIDIANLSYSPKASSGWPCIHRRFSDSRPHSGTVGFASDVPSGGVTGWRARGVGGPQRLRLRRVLLCQRAWAKLTAVVPDDQLTECFLQICCRCSATA